MFNTEFTEKEFYQNLVAAEKDVTRKIASLDCIPTDQIVAKLENAANLLKFAAMEQDSNDVRGLIERLNRAKRDSATKGLTSLRMEENYKKRGWPFNAADDNAAFDMLAGNNFTDTAKPTDTVVIDAKESSVPSLEQLDMISNTIIPRVAHMIKLHLKRNAGIKSEEESIQHIKKQLAEELSRTKLAQFGAEELADDIVLEALKKIEFDMKTINIDLTPNAYKVKRHF